VVKVTLTIKVKQSDAHVSQKDTENGTITCFLLNKQAFSTTAVNVDSWMQTRPSTETKPPNRTQHADAASQELHLGTSRPAHGSTFC